MGIYKRTKSLQTGDNLQLPTKNVNEVCPNNPFLHLLIEHSRPLGTYEVQCCRDEPSHYPAMGQTTQLRKQGQVGQTKANRYFLGKKNGAQHAFAQNN